jgi:hypothetical protein
MWDPEHLTTPQASTACFGYILDFLLCEMSLVRHNFRKTAVVVVINTTFHEEWRLLGFYAAWLFIRTDVS